MAEKRIGFLLRVFLCEIKILDTTNTGIHAQLIQKG